MVIWEDTMATQTTITDWDIQALLDNELSEAEQTAILRAMRDDFALRERYDNLRRQRDALRLWWKSQ
jgi:anti-sigma factor RsiW